MTGSLDLDKWKDRMVLLAIADAGGTATVPELRDDLEPLLGEDSLGSKISYRADKTDLIEKRESDQTADNGVPYNEYYLTNHACDLLFGDSLVEDLREERNDLSALSEERRLAVLLADMNRLKREVSELTSVAAGEGALAESLDDDDIVQLSSRLDSISGRLGAVIRRLNKLEARNGERELPAYSEIDDRVAKTETRVEELEEVVDERINSFVAEQGEKMKDLHDRLQEIERRTQQIEGEHSRYGDYDNLWRLTLLNTALAADAGEMTLEQAAKQNHLAVLEHLSRTVFDDLEV
ncbi:MULTISPECIES: hypothetical protein [Halobacterium]|uniref:hypothetical protein n=1 Tax=Halobacterium TaxID=2239 RepID=UPI00073E9CA6|nr:MULTISPECIES: hypothetical protein [Halobacterium]MCG1001908.1 hypothetical protein [Halobacterium noricense]